MLSENFCSLLEYRISQALSHVTNKELRAYWCDGIFVPQSADFFTTPDGRQGVVTTAIIPKGEYNDPNFRFEMTIWFGSVAQALLNNDHDLEPSIPVDETNQWIDLDATAYTIEVRLS